MEDIDSISYYQKYLNLKNKLGGAAVAVPGAVAGRPTYLLIGFNNTDQIKQANPPLANNIDYFAGRLFHKHDDYANIPDNHYDFVIVDHGLHRMVIRQGGNIDQSYYYMSPVERMMVFSQIFRILKSGGKFIFPYIESNELNPNSCTKMDVNDCDIHQSLYGGTRMNHISDELKLLPSTKYNSNNLLTEAESLDYYGYYFNRDTVNIVDFPLRRNPNDPYLEHKSNWRYYQVTPHIKISR